MVNKTPGANRGSRNKQAAKPENGTGNKRKTSKTVKRAFTVVFSLFLVALLTVCIVLSYVLTYMISFTNGDVAIDLEEYKGEQSQTSFIYAYNKNGDEVEYARLHGEENRVWVDLDEMSPYLLKAYISLEDKRFREHKGVDWYRFFGVVTKYIGQGASTITQQLIKNLTMEKDVTAVRKFREILFALNLEKHYTKDTILEAYLNTLYLGNGCYGVKTAAETYLGKEPDELTLAECASIAAITQAPYTYDPLINPENNRERQTFCLNEMLVQGVISKKEYDEAINQKMVFTNSKDYVPKETEKKTEKTDKVNNFYVDFIIDSVIEDLQAKYGYTLQQATRKIYYGGLKIYAAVDMDVQKKLEDVYVNRVTFPKEKDTPSNPAVQSAMTVLDYKGRVVGIIGQAGPKKTNRCLNRAADSPRQPGSTIKPIATYAPAIEFNYVNWSTKILDYGFPYQGMRIWPKNVDGSHGSNSKVTVQYAIEKSLNTVPARLIVNTLTPKKSMEFLRDKFHITTLDDVTDSYASPMTAGALTNGISSLEIAAAYAAFGNGGKYYKPYCYYKVMSSDGKEVLLENKPVGEQILSAETADIMCELLQTVNTTYYGKGPHVRKSDIMAKTGTTDDDKDRWFVAGTPYYVSSVWYGYDKPKTLPAGLNPAAKIFIEVFDRIHKDLPAKQFEKHGSVVSKKYCSVSGLLAGKNCASTKTGWYSLNHLPRVCSSCSAPVEESVSKAIDDIVDIILPDATQAADNP